MILDDIIRFRQEQDLQHPVQVCHFCGHMGLDVHQWGSYVGGVGSVPQCDDIDECRYRKDRKLGMEHDWHLWALSPHRRRQLDLEVEGMK